MIRRRILAASLALLGVAVSSGRSEADIIYGTGQGNVFAYNTGTGMTSTLLSGLTAPTGIAVGPDGNLYVSEQNSSGGGYFIEKYSQSGQDLGTFAAGLSSSYRGIGLAFDSSGDLFATESGGVIHEFYAGGGGRDLTASGGPSLPYQLTVSSSGILYATDSGSSNVYQYDTTQATPTPSVFATLSGGTGNGVYVNSLGNVFVSNLSGTYEYTSGGTQVGSPFSSRPGYGLTYDAGANSLFLVNPPALYAVNPTTGSSSQVSNGFLGTEYLADAAPSIETPEPSTMAMALAGGLGISVVALVRRKRTPRG